MSEIRFDSIGTSAQTGKDETAELLAGDAFKPPVLADGRHAIRYYIEEDRGGNLMLPQVDGQRALKSLREAFETLVEEVKVNALDFKQAGTREEANLIITSKPDLGSGKIASTDRTSDGRHRITFNSSKRFDEALFEATAAHAFEISFGYPARKYESIPDDPYFKK